MSDAILRKVTLAVAVVLLALSSPSWLAGKGPVSSGYDAPWVYPALDP